MFRLTVGSLLLVGLADGEILGAWDGTPIEIPDGLAAGSQLPDGLVDGGRLWLIVVYQVPCPSEQPTQSRDIPSTI
jgi:hypothetical protein